MKIEVPKYFTLKHIEDFLDLVTDYLKGDKRDVSDFILDVSKVKDICLLGQLLLYKFISFTAEHQCFKNPTIYVLKNTVVKVLLEETGFWELIDTYIKKPDNKRAIEKSYNNLKITNKNNFLIAPQKLLRIEETNRKELEDLYLNKVLDFYKNTSKAHTIVFCIAELFSNFWSHATEDSGTIMVAKGDSNNIEICFADTGEGIINSFRNSDFGYRNLSKKEIMRMALKKRVTSKPNSNHLGMGLFMINCIVTSCSQSVFRIYSDTERYFNNDNKIYNVGSYWKGTITYLKFNIENLLSLDKIDELKTPSYNKIQWS